MKIFYRPGVKLMMLTAAIWLQCVGTGAHASDSLSVLRQFMQVCNSYKQLPLHVNINVQNKADVITEPKEDTAFYSVDFFIRSNGAYIKMSDDEEIINDSLMLLISYRPKRLMLYPNKGNVKTQLNSFVSGFSQDSSILKFAARYNAVELRDSLQDQGVSTIKVASKALLPGTVLPKEVIEVKYRIDNKQPVTLVQMHRTMLALDSANYESLQKKPGYAGKLVHPGKGYFFLVKEFSSTYTFNIDHDDTKPLPMLIENYLTKKPTGHYAQVAGFEAFELSENL